MPKSPAWILLYVSLVLFIVMFCYGMVRTIRKRKWRKSQGYQQKFTWKETLVGRSAIAALVALVFWAITVVSLTVPAFENTVALKNGKAVMSFPKGTSYWRWGKTATVLEGTVIENYAKQEIYSSLATRPISANPEVRDLVIEIDLEVGGTPEDYVLFRNSSWFVDRDASLKYQLYEFDEEYHGRLAEFYNPNRADQQQKFEGYFRTFMESKLQGTGVRIAYARFKR